MKPFSAWYYIRENKQRSILLIAMIFLSFGVYIGGLYVTNASDNWEYHFNTQHKFVWVHSNTTDDIQYNKFIEQIKADNIVTIIDCESKNGMHWENIMGFESGQCAYTFSSVDDFKHFCELMEIECDYTKLKGGSMIMSERFALNKGLDIGDKVDKDVEWNIFDEYTLDVTTKEDGYTLYFIENNAEQYRGAVLIGNDIEGDELYKYVYSVQSKLESPKDVFVYKGVEKDIEDQFAIFDLIYTFIVILFSIMLAITINAAFVGMYQHREFEFSVYRAIGISKISIVKKIACELLLIDMISLLVGTVLMLIGLYLLNNLVLYQVGMYLRYFNKMAFAYMFLCNMIIIVPLIITRCRQMLKMDICEY